MVHRRKKEKFTTRLPSDNSYYSPRHVNQTSSSQRTHDSCLLSLEQTSFSFSILNPCGGCSELNYLRRRLPKIFHKIIFRIALRTDSLQAVHLSYISTVSTKMPRHVQLTRPFSATSLTIRELSRHSIPLLFDAQTVWRVLCFYYDGIYEEEDRNLIGNYNRSPDVE